jgi:hypothetical protein
MSPWWKLMREDINVDVRQSVLKLLRKGVGLSDGAALSVRTKDAAVERRCGCGKEWIVRQLFFTRFDCVSCNLENAFEAMMGFV